jgi:acyl-CoA reductase-like NAD-dependent aldehyde dehydrogenase
MWVYYFLPYVVEKTEKLKVRNGLEPSTDIGPLIARFQLDVVLKYIEGAKNKKTMKKFLRRGGIFRCPKYGIFKIIQDLDFLLIKTN